MPGILGANKYYKSDWRLVAYLIPRQALEDNRTKLTDREVGKLHNKGDDYIDRAGYKI